MEPRHPSFPVEPDPEAEEPLEVPDYYEAIQDRLKSDDDENHDQAVNPLKLPQE